MTILFNQLPIGARFEFRGRRYEKLALSLAWDEDRTGNIFLGETEVLPDAAEGRSGAAPAATVQTKGRE